MYEFRYVEAPRSHQKMYPQQHETVVGQYSYRYQMKQIVMSTFMCMVEHSKCLDDEMHRAALARNCNFPFRPNARQGLIHLSHLPPKL